MFTGKRRVYSDKLNENICQYSRNIRIENRQSAYSRHVTDSPNRLQTTADIPERENGHAVGGLSARDRPADGASKPCRGRVLLPSLLLIIPPTAGTLSAESMRAGVAYTTICQYSATQSR